MNKTTKVHEGIVSKYSLGERAVFFSIRKYFNHELREARISLDRDRPNIDMALSRICHMEEYIQDIWNEINF